MKTIRWIAHLDSSGQIRNLFMSGSEIAQEGSTTSEGYTVKHVLSTDPDYPTDQFCDKFYWNGSSWVDRGLPPTRYYIWNTETVQWDVNTEAVLTLVRFERNSRLGLSDWTQAVDAPLTDEKKAEWRIYRQALRDIMTNIAADLDDPENVSWPTKPS